MSASRHSVKKIVICHWDRFKRMRTNTYWFIPLRIIYWYVRRVLQRLDFCGGEDNEKTSGVGVLNRALNNLAHEWFLFIEVDSKISRGKGTGYVILVWQIFPQKRLQEESVVDAIFPISVLIFFKAKSDKRYNQ